MLPDFLIIGAPKAATTSLYHYLNQHPSVFLTSPKELNFFTGDDIRSQGLYYNDFIVDSLSDYEDFFISSEPGQAKGEASVSYLFYAQAPFNIKKQLPNVKLIVLLRNPLHRGFSHYLMDHRLGLCKLSYDDVVFRRSSHPNKNLYYQQYVELGLYAAQLKRYFDVFERDQIKIYLQEDLQAKPEEIMHDLFKFLDVNPDFKLDFQKKHNSFSVPKNKLVQNLYTIAWLRKLLANLFPEKIKEKVLDSFFDKNAKKPEISDDALKFLKSVYNPDIEDLENLINRDLSHWKV